MSYIKSGGRSIYYEIHGDTGTPILLLNGIMMTTSSWGHFSIPLSIRNRLILMDFFDQGRSDKLSSSYTQWTQVEAVKDLIEKLGLEQLTVAGISYGGEVALGLAVKHPELLDKLVLMNTTSMDTQRLRNTADIWDKYTIYADLVYHNMGMPRYNSNNVMAQWVNLYRDLMVPQMAMPSYYHAMNRLAHSTENFDVHTLLERITADTLIIAGGNDYLTPAENQVYIADNIKNSKIVVLNNCGHNSVFEQPQLVCSMILNFVNSA